MAYARTIVQKPRVADGGCWAAPRRYTGSLWPQYSSCDRRPRPGRLTCGQHAKFEAQAQRLKAEEERTT